jgi:hypothetical protein
MSVYKEFYAAAHKIQAASKTIWHDSADFGVRVKKGDVMWKLAELITQMYFMPALDRREVVKYSTGTTVTSYITVFNEWTGSMDEEVWKMEYVAVRNNPQFDGFLSIEKVSTKKTKYSDD